MSLKPTNLGIEEADGGFQVRPVLGDDAIANCTHNAGDEAHHVKKGHAQLKHDVPPVTAILLHAAPPPCGTNQKNYYQDISPVTCSNPCSTF